MKNNLRTKWTYLLAGIVVSSLFVTGLAAQTTFPTPGLTLPNGKTIVITYDVDVNANVCPTGTIPTDISNQSNVSGSNFATVQTDEPSNPAPNPSPTLTPVSGLGLGDLVYKDNNNNGVFDAGDAGVNGVLVRLYADDGDGVLDAGDGAPLATATTAGGGLYTFPSLCPGDYIVEIATSNFAPGGPLYDNGLSAALVSSPVGGAPDPDNDINNDDNGDPVAGFGIASAAITLALTTEPVNDGDADNNTNLSLDFGFKNPTTVSINDVTLAEGTGGSTTAFSFTVTRSIPNEAFSLTVNTADGTATAADNDFVAISGGTVSFTAGGSLTQTVTVLVNHDNKVETNETFSVVLSGAPTGVIISDGTGLGTITNDDAATVTLIIPNTSPLEGASGLVSLGATMMLDNPVQGSFMVTYTPTPGTATFADLDFAGPTGTETFSGAAGQSIPVQISIRGDTKVELDETFTISLSISGAPAGVTVANSPMTVTILNDDAATVTIANVSQNEGNAGTTPFTFTVTLNGQVDAAVSMDFATLDGSATIANNDYATNSGAVTPFAANGGASQTRTITVNVNGDMTFEGNETFLVRLSALAASGRNVSFSPAGATLDGTGTIVNDDLPPVIINEVDADQVGTDAMEFVELYDGGVGNTNLNGLVLVLYNGSNDLSYLAIDLDGFTTNANGYFIAGNSGVPGVDAVFGNDILQNGQDAVALFVGNATDFPTGTAVTTTNLIDALVYDTADPDDPGLLVLLNAGQPQIDENGGGDGTCHSMQRIPNGSGGPRNTSTYQALPPTPDAANFIPIVSIAVSPASTPEDGVPNLTYTITRTGATTCPLSVPFTVTGTATSGTDYAALAASPVTIPAGSISTTLVVNPNTDNTVEPDETVIITLTDGTSYDLGTGAATGTITNDDAATVTLSGGASQNEGTTFTFTATLNNPVQGGFTVPYATNDGTAMLANNDYTDNDGVLTFAGTAGETKTFTINTTADITVELDETFTVTLGAIAGAPAGVTTVGSPQTGTILNDDVATVSLAGNVSQAENLTPQVFTVNLSNPVDVQVTVVFNTSNGTASTADNDYTAVTNQTVTFAPNTTTAQTVNVAILNDNKVEANEVYNVTLGTLNAMGRNLTLGTSTGTGTIVNDDAAIVTLAGGSAANEGNVGTNPRVFTATLNNPVQGGFTLPYTTNNGTATAGSDYVDNDGTLTFDGTTGEIQTITVLVNGDFFVEANETFTVALGAITGAPAGLTTAGSPQTATINNDEVDWGDGPDTLPTLLFMNGARHNTLFGFQLGAAIDGDPDGQPGILANGDDNDAEGDDEDGVTLPSAFVTGTTATITVNASQAGKLDAFMDFNWNRNLGDAGEKIFNNVALTAGDNVLSFNVPAGAVLGSSYIRFRFSSAGGLAHTGTAADGEVEDYRVQIVSNQFSIDNPSVAEGNAGTTNLTFTVTRTTNNTASSVNYAITGGTATAGSDYTSIPAGTINFTAGGALSQTITVSVNGDLVVEDNETIIVTLSAPVNGGIGSGTGTGTITNDDNATLTLAGGSSLTETNAGTVAHTFTVTLSAAVQGGFQVAYATTNGTATAGSDYTDNDGILTFAGTAGETKTIVVQAAGDITVELNETFTENLGAISATTAVQAAAITIVGSPQTATIVNDDAATVSLAGNVSQAENLTPQVFTVNLSNPVDVAVTVQFSTSDGTATTADNDYTGIPNQTVMFAAGTTTAQTVNVTIINDNKVENNEVYNVALSGLNATGRNVSLGTSTGTGTIVNDDAATVTLTPAGGITQSEGNTGTTLYQFFATLNNPVQGSFTVNYTTNNGTATAGSDYIDNDGIVSFSGAAGQSQPISVLVNGDFLVEPNEDFTVSLGAITGAPAGVTVAGSPQTGFIINDEFDFGDAPTAAQSGFAGSYVSGSKFAQFGYSLGAAIDGDPASQPTATANGDDADAEGDDEDGVTLPSVLVTSTTATITVNANLTSTPTGGLYGWVDFNRDGDWSDPGEQVFTNVALSNGNNNLVFSVPVTATPGGSFARFILTNNPISGPGDSANIGEVEDYAIQIVDTQFSINDPSVTEGNAGTSNLVFTVTRSTNASNASVNYAITGGTATTADNDYQPLAAGTLNFTAGGALTATITVVVNGDVKVELNETVEITLSNPVNASILDGLGIGTITNDDAAVLTVTNPTVTEGDTPNTVTATFTINMSNPSDANVVVNYATVDNTATIANNDYVSTSGTHTFTPGQQSKTVSVTVNGDCAIEPNESFFLRLSGLVNNGRNVSLSGGGATLDGTATITNDDALPVISCPANLTVNAAAGVCNATVTLPLPTTSSVCGSFTLEYRYRTVDASNVPTGAFTAYASAASNVVNFAVGRYEIEWRITDGSGASSCSFFLRVVDNQPPVITCPANQTVSANASCMGTVGSWAPVALSDNCSPAPTVVQAPVASTVLSGHNDSELVTLTATDVNGNTASCTFTVTLKDVTPPVAVCKNIVLNLGAAGTITLLPSLVNNGSADNCGVTLSVMPNTFTCANIGNNTVTLKATDPGNNMATCTATVKIQDVTAPQAKCKNINVFLDNSGHASIVAADVNNGSSDACGISSMTINYGEFDCGQLGATPVTVQLTVKDLYNNQASCLAYVYVKDIIAPTAVCTNTTVNLGPGGSVAVPTAPLAANSTDNCGVTSYSPTAKSYNSSNLGVNNLTITVKDFSGNAATCVSQVTVLPNNSVQPGSNPNGQTKTGSDLALYVLEMAVFPNPTAGKANLWFELPQDQAFTLRLFDLNGRLVLRQQQDGKAGENIVPLFLEELPAGLYLLDVKSEGLRGRQKVMIQRD